MAGPMMKMPNMEKMPKPAGSTHKQMPGFTQDIGTAIAVKRLPNGKIVQVDPRANMAPRKSMRGGKVAY